MFITRIPFSNTLAFVRQSHGSHAFSTCHILVPDIWWGVLIICTHSVRVVREKMTPMNSRQYCCSILLKAVQVRHCLCSSLQCGAVFPMLETQPTPASATKPNIQDIVTIHPNRRMLANMTDHHRQKQRLESVEVALL